MPVKTAKKPAAVGFNLTKATQIGRVVVKFGAIALVVLMVGRVLINGMVALWIAANPEPPPPPTQGFGALPEIEFGTAGSNIKPKSYQLELPGEFPEFADRALVYFQPKGQLGLLSLEETKNTAASLGFFDEPIGLDVDDYRWRRAGTIDATLEMNTVTKNLRYSTDYLSRPEVQLNDELPNTFDAVQTVKQFLNSANLLPEDLATTYGETQFLKITGGTLSEAVSLSDAQVIRVDLFRTLVDGYPAYTADGESGLVSATVAALDGRPTVIELTRDYAPLDYELASTYPLRPVQEAWQLLKADEGHVAAARREDVAVIRSVSLGYFESATQLYLQPIYVFTGDTGFIGYVSALSTSVQTAPKPTPTKVPLPSARPGTPGL